MPTLAFRYCLNITILGQMSKFIVYFCKCGHKHYVKLLTFTVSYSKTCSDLKLIMYFTLGTQNKLNKNPKYIYMFCKICLYVVQESSFVGELKCIVVQYLTFVEKNYNTK